MYALVIVVITNLMSGQMVGIHQPILYESRAACVTKAQDLKLLEATAIVKGRKKFIFCIKVKEG